MVAWRVINSSLRSGYVMRTTGGLSGMVSIRYTAESRDSIPSVSSSKTEKPDSPLDGTVKLPENSAEDWPIRLMGMISDGILRRTGNRDNSESIGNRKRTDAPTNLSAADWQ